MHKLMVQQYELSNAEDSRYREVAGLLKYWKNLLLQKDAYLEKVARADHIAQLMT
jgi:hypothetical protein